ncbi:MAG: winged helix-turn-helix domain-containing protein [Candidatus Thermoplasmatota archaeon]|nr:winged helix-turn-helix domain-containing protein [Candidatus Thermoplasmatota archaeon]
MIYKNKRCEFEIIHCLLDGAKQGIKKTPLMYKSNLSPNHFQEYIDFLLDKDLISLENNDNGNIFFITDKGINALDHIQKAIEHIN